MGRGRYGRIPRLATTDSGPILRPMTDLPVTLPEILAARERVAGHIHRTPVLGSATAARLIAARTGVEIADGRLFAKAEHLQRTGSFKPRAAFNRIASLTPAERERGAVTVSAGNAGQAYAWAGREAGVPVTVVMPKGAVASKVAACRGYGARVVLHGDDVGETLRKMEELVADGLTLVHPYDQPEVIAGNASLGLELLDDLPDVDVVVVPVGGGGLIGGVSLALHLRAPHVRVIGVEPEQSDALRRGLERGAPVPIQPRSIADGLGAPAAGRLAIEIGRRAIEEVVLVDEATILAGIRFAVERMKQVLEPAGATALGAVLAGAVPIRSGERVCVILSGGNIALERLGAFLEAAPAIDG